MFHQKDIGKLSALLKLTETAQGIHAFENECLRLLSASDMPSEQRQFMMALIGLFSARSLDAINAFKACNAVANLFDRLEDEAKQAQVTAKAIKWLTKAVPIGDYEPFYEMGCDSWDHHARQSCEKAMS